MTGAGGALPIVSVAAVRFSLAAIDAIGANPILQRERRRGGDRQSHQPLAAGVDPVKLRRLIFAVLITGAFRAPLGLG